MGNIWQLIGRSLVGGAVFAAACAGSAGFFCLLYRLVKRMRPKAARQQDLRLLSHRLYKVSGRARIAYLILCLEGALRSYRQDLSAWDWVLRRLWSITDCSENNGIDIWLDRVEALLPSTVLTDDTAGGEAAKARALYTQAGTAMIVINAVIENAYMIVCEWSPDTAAHDPDALCRVDKAEDTMRAFGVPLPSGEILQPLFQQKDPSLGKPFDGSRLSCISKQMAGTGDQTDDIRNGSISISDQLTIYPGFSFEQFKRTKFYNGQDGIKTICLDGPQMIHGRKYMVNLFFRNGTIYMVSLICCEQEFSEQDEEKRKRFHDDILNASGLRPRERFHWGKISSDYDGRSNLSSINVEYFN